jgi:hypothetical protein
VTDVQTYQAESLALSTTAATQVAEVYAALTAGQITQAAAEELIATIVNHTASAAVFLADVWLSIQIENATGEVTVPVGVLPEDNTDRLVAAVNTILDADPETAPDPDMRLERLARAETLDAGHRATSEAMVGQPLVEGWTRQMDGDPCQLCKWWWREGRVWPKVHPFQRHKGCNCQPRIVTRRHINSTGFSRRYERNKAS